MNELQEQPKDIVAGEGVEGGKGAEKERERKSEKEIEKVLSCVEWNVCF